MIQILKKKDRQLIMQSLFSRADTGLLKDDSGPTMPNDITGKFFWWKMKSPIDDMDIV